MNRILLLLLATAIFFSVSSCRKIREDNLVRGTWQLQSIKIDTFSINNRANFLVRNFIDTAMANQEDFTHSLLPAYTANKPAASYRIKFDKDDISFSYYNIADSNVYAVLGRWDLTKADELLFRSDNFIDGYFKVVNKNLNEYEFISEQNYLKLLNDTIKMTMNIKRVK